MYIYIHFSLTRRDGDLIKWDKVKIGHYVGFDIIDCFVSGEIGYIYKHKYCLNLSIN